MARPLMCAPELLQQNLNNKTVVITGANSGIGLATTRQLVRQGAQVIMACRRLEEAEARAAELRQETPGINVEAHQLDLGNLGSVHAFCARLLKDHPTLHALVNNAGVMNTPKGTTQDGFELQFGINHLGHFLLTELLTDALKAGAPSRIVNVSSCFHDCAMGRRGDIHLDDLHYREHKYDGWEAYAQSKLANVLHAKGLAKRLEGTGVTAVSVHPGWVRTNLARHSMPLWVQNRILSPFLRVAGMIEPWEGAQATLHALLEPSVSEHSGAFYSQTGMYRDRSCNKGGWPLRSPNPKAHDDALADALWDKSLELVGLRKAEEHDLPSGHALLGA